jgi:hypothetical protein
MTNLLRAPVLGLLAGVLLSACGGTDGDDDRAPSAREARTASPSPSQGRSERDPEASGGTAIQITFDDTEFRARLLVNATARDLAAQLPLTLKFRDHNSAEKTAPLPRELSTEGAPAGHDPAAGDIGHWAPDGDLVLYYDDAAPFFDGIIRIGEFHGDLAALERQPDGVSVTVERAG